MKFKNRIIVDEIEQPLRAQGEAKNNLSWLEVLAGTVDDAGFDERDHAIGDQFAVYAKIFAIHEKSKHGIGNAADSGLQDGPVLDQAGDVASDLDLSFVTLGIPLGTQGA